MAFDTYLLDRALADRKRQYEQQRLATLAQVKHWLEEQGPKYGIDHAYIFGSLTQPYRFTPRSDVDVAVEPLPPDQFFAAMAALSETVERSVDLVDLLKCPFRDRIRQLGEQWMRTG